eukprot:TRINITY_DN3258_c0_g1_i8.p1 TRINITY_DN3258_c0_g1~~TRINITY_DN3258_c0_g1_i8.p1  ORF type:complete len:347 (-),score=99.75 TRINITY_DN3258_c0_g1_i8:301-1341(-)
MGALAIPRNHKRDQNPILQQKLVHEILQETLQEKEWGSQSPRKWAWDHDSEPENVGWKSNPFPEHLRPEKQMELPKQTKKEQSKEEKPDQGRVQQNNLLANDQKTGLVDRSNVNSKNDHANTNPIQLEANPDAYPTTNNRPNVTLTNSPSFNIKNHPTNRSKEDHLLMLRQKLRETKEGHMSKEEGQHQNHRPTPPPSLLPPPPAPTPGPAPAPAPAPASPPSPDQQVVHANERLLEKLRKAHANRTKKRPREESCTDLEDQSPKKLSNTQFSQETCLDSLPHFPHVCGTQGSMQDTSIISIDPNENFSPLHKKEKQGLPLRVEVGKQLRQIRSQPLDTDTFLNLW